MERVLEARGLKSMSAPGSIGPLMAALILQLERAQAEDRSATVRDIALALDAHERIVQKAIERLRARKSKLPSCLVDRRTLTRHPMPPRLPRERPPPAPLPDAATLVQSALRSRSAVELAWHLLPMPALTDFQESTR